MEPDLFIEKDTGFVKYREGKTNAFTVGKSRIFSLFFFVVYRGLPSMAAATAAAGVPLVAN